MTKKFNELYENIQIGFPISVQNPSREVPETIGYDMGQELNDKELARINDLITNDGKLVNRYPTNLKVKFYQHQLERLSPSDLNQAAEHLGFENADQHKPEELIPALVNYLGARPEAWKSLSPLIFTESDEDDEEVEESEDDSEWINSKSHDTFWDFGDDDDDEYDPQGNTPWKVPAHDHRHEIISWDDNYDNVDEMVIKKDVVRDGKKVVIKKTDKDDTKLVKGKEIKMNHQEKKARSEAATKREKSITSISKKRQPSFKKSIDVKRGLKRTNERRRRK